MDILIQGDAIVARFDLVPLFSSFRMCDSLDIMNLITNRAILAKCSLSIDVIKCLKLCLESTYFTFEEKLHFQTNTVSMGLPASPIVTNLDIEALERKALTSFSCHPRKRYIYVDYRFIIIEKAEKENILTQINLIPKYAVY
ncbi:unnamed protein product [Trichobilharzia regenti]|nr:unnamed protein product [Trichobilharzia regenti]